MGGGGGQVISVNVQARLGHGVQKYVAPSLLLPPWISAVEHCLDWWMWITTTTWMSAHRIVLINYTGFDVYPRYYKRAFLPRYVTSIRMGLCEIRADRWCRSMHLDVAHMGTTQGNFQALQFVLWACFWNQEGFRFLPCSANLGQVGAVKHFKFLTISPVVPHNYLRATQHQQFTVPTHLAWPAVRTGSIWVCWITLGVIILCYAMIDQEIIGFHHCEALCMQAMGDVTLLLNAR